MPGPLTGIVRERACGAVRPARWRCTVIGGQPRLPLADGAGLPARLACPVNKPGTGSAVRAAWSCEMRVKMAHYLAFAQVR
jgi:hypothetical protein